MKETRYFYVPDAAAQNELPDEEALHALRVLRLRSGDEMFLMDGQGTFYRAVVETAATRRCTYIIKETLPQQKAWCSSIHLAIAPTKSSDRMEWLAEKATEVGFDRMTMLSTRFTERKTVRMGRLEKVVVAAVKQSRKPWMPQLENTTRFADFVKTDRQGAKFIAHCYDEIERSDLFEELKRVPDDCPEVTILVGPEGDFSIDEVQLAEQCGYRSVSFGPSRLRTETAGLMAVVLSELALRR